MQTGELPSRLREIAPPSECGLLQWLRARISRLMLEEISQNDYGQWSDRYFAAIQAQLADDAPVGSLP